MEIWSDQDHGLLLCDLAKVVHRITSMMTSDGSAAPGLAMLALETPESFLDRAGLQSSWHALQLKLRTSREFPSLDRHPSQHEVGSMSREHMRLSPTNKLSLFAVTPVINGANSAVVHWFSKLNCNKILPRYLGEGNMQ
jgi:hypothetical protein